MYRIIGIERFSYVSKRDGKSRSGTRLFLTFDSERIDGTGCMEAYCRGHVDTEGLEVGDVITLLYDQWKNVAAVVPVPSEQ